MANVSIHAPVKGRPDRICRSRRLRCFNPRPCEGATDDRKRSPRSARRFNPRPCEGATWMTSLSRQRPVFQSTPL